MTFYAPFEGQPCCLGCLSSLALDRVAAPPCDEGVLCVYGFEIVRRDFVVFCRPGSDRLSRVLRHSTIGAEEFNG